VGVRHTSTSARQLAPIGPTDRTRTIAFLDAAAASGRIGSTEKEDRLELVFRARLVGELDAAVAGLPGAAELQLEVRGLTKFERRAAGWGWQRRLVAWTIGSVLFWTLVWAVTGGSPLWLGATMLLTLLAFTFRFARRGKAGLRLSRGAGRRGGLARL